MSIVAVIPARGGSKGIPGKNLRPVAGIPLVMRSIAAARSCGLIDRVVVSTDDPAIEEAALAAEAEVVDRPAHLSGDRATSESAVLHALDHIDPPAEIVVLLQPTSPFIDSAALCEAIERVRSGREDVVFSAVETFAFLWQLDDQGRALYRGRLRQVRWRPEMASSGYLGGHVGPDSPAFLRKYVVPLLTPPEPQKC